MEWNSDNNEQRILIAVDCIIFGFDGEQLKTLLVRKEFDDGKSNWSVIREFIRPEETAENATSRLLRDVTGMTNVYMEQLHTSSALDRHPARRVISIAYFALINISKYIERHPLEHEKKWFSLDDLPSLIFDHREMILKTQSILREKVATHALGFELLPQKFTMSQLKCLYEAIYGTALDRRNFIKKINSLGILKKLSEKEKTSSRKGAFYYVLIQEKNKYCSGR